MDQSYSRRDTLKLIGASATVYALGGIMGSEVVQSVAGADEFDMLRRRWRDLLTGGDAYDPAEPVYAHAIAALDNRVRGYWERMRKTVNRTALWSDQGPGTSDTSFITTSYNWLAEMARAYATRGSAFAGHSDLLGDTVGGLDWLYDHVYNERQKQYGNWWDWEIGTPLALNNASVLLSDQLSSTQLGNYMRAIDTFTPDPVPLGKGISTGANRVWKVEVVGLRAVLLHDATKLARARDTLDDVFPYVTSGDGFYTDGSFIQHGKHPYTGGYGIDLLMEIGNILYLLGGSAYAVTDPGVQNVFDVVTSAFAPLIYRGAMMDMVRGREVSRYSNQDHVSRARRHSCHPHPGTGRASGDRARFQADGERMDPARHLPRFLRHRAPHCRGAGTSKPR